MDSKAGLQLADLVVLVEGVQNAIQRMTYTNDEIKFLMPPFARVQDWVNSTRRTQYTNLYSERATKPAAAAAGDTSESPTDDPTDGPTGPTDPPSVN